MPTPDNITIVCSPRARHITLTVKPSGEVRVSYPRGVDATRVAAFIHEKREWIERAKARLQARQKVLPPTLSAEGQHALTERLRREAKATLPQRLKELAEAAGLHYGRVSIRASRSKWGSCSGTNNISLSLYLMTLPSHLRDFVMLHELCHTLHHNHSPRFHALLDSLCGGNEKALNRELRRYAIRG